MKRCSLRANRIVTQKAIFDRPYRHKIDGVLYLSVEFIQMMAAHVYSSVVLINMISCHGDDSFISRVLFGTEHGKKARWYPRHVQI
jgi:hypothetical protein